MIYLLLRAFWCWWFWQHTLGPCTAWHNVARLRRPPWRNRQRRKYTIELDVEPKNISLKPFRNGLKGHLCSLFVFHASKCFILRWTVKKNSSYAQLPLYQKHQQSQIRNKNNTQVFNAQIFMIFTREQNVEHTLSFKSLLESIFRKTCVMKITWDGHDNGLMSFLTG